MTGLVNAIALVGHRRRVVHEPRVRRAVALRGHDRERVPGPRIVHRPQTRPGFDVVDERVDHVGVARLAGQVCVRIAAVAGPGAGGGAVLRAHDVVVGVARGHRGVREGQRVHAALTQVRRRGNEDRIGGAIDVVGQRPRAVGRPRRPVDVQAACARRRLRDRGRARERRGQRAGAGGQRVVAVAEAGLGANGVQERDDVGIGGAARDRVVDVGWGGHVAGEQGVDRLRAGSDRPVHAVAGRARSRGPGHRDLVGRGGGGDEVHGTRRRDGRDGRAGAGRAEAGRPTRPRPPRCRSTDVRCRPGCRRRRGR